MASWPQRTVSVFHSLERELCFPVKGQKNAYKMIEESDLRILVRAGLTPTIQELEGKDAKDRKKHHVTLFPPHYFHFSFLLVFRPKHQWKHGKNHPEARDSLEHTVINQLTSSRNGRAPQLLLLETKFGSLSIPSSRLVMLI